VFSLHPLASVASAAAADLVGFESVGAASALSGRWRTGKGKGARALEGLEEAVEVVVEVVERVGVVRSGGFGPCAYVLRTGDRAVLRVPVTCVYRLNPGIEAAALGAGEAAALGASASAAPGASASAAPGAGVSALSSNASAQASTPSPWTRVRPRSFFRDRTTLTPLSRPVAVSLADPSGGPSLLASPLSYRARQPPLAPYLVSTSPRFSTKLGERSGPTG
ncbi:unnamed protein product, partial [Closterium sp. NIES-65]